MRSVRQTYILHAEVVRLGDHSEAFDDATAGHPLERRLNRTERAAATFGGRIQLRFAEGMRILFDDADAALQSACEMQLRCAQLPQVAQLKMVLRIGIECQRLRQRAQDGQDGQSQPPVEATRLAVLDDGIVVAPCLAGALNKDLQGLLRPLPADAMAQLQNAGANGLAQGIDWRGRNASAAFPDSRVDDPTARRPAALSLHYGERNLIVDAEAPHLSIGRDPKSGLVVDDVHSSRHHCRIVFDGQSFVLTDLSTNGTTIVPVQGSPYTVKKASVTLDRPGHLFFGRPYKGDRRGSARFEIR